MNKDLPGGKERIQQHQKKFASLLRNVDKFLEKIDVVNPTISFELPSFCEYWKWKSVKNFKRKYRLNDYKLHGCQVGVTDEHGTPIKKGWTISSDIEAFAALEQLCPAISPLLACLTALPDKIFNPVVLHHVVILRLTAK